MIYDEKAKCLRREDGSLTVHVDEIEDGRIYFDIALKGMTRVSMLEIEEIIALGGRDYAAGRRAGIEDAAKACKAVSKAAESHELELSTDADDCDAAFANGEQQGSADCEAAIRALLEAKT